MIKTTRATSALDFPLQSTRSTVYFITNNYYMININYVAATTLSTNITYFRHHAVHIRTTTVAAEGMEFLRGERGHSERQDAGPVGRNSLKILVHAKVSCRELGRRLSVKK